MPRARVKDRLQNFRFHLLDISPSLTFPPFVLNPLAGFSAITIPEVTIETEEVAEGNYYFKHHVISGASISNLTLSRGVSIFDGDFWRWVTATIRGDVGALLPPITGGQRRNLLLIHYTGYDLLGSDEDRNPGVDKLQAVSSIAKGFLPDFGAVTRIPGRAFMLFDALPVRYKPGSDFDATSSDINVAELELSIARFEELNLMG